jgi:hypothetical protein
VQHRPFRSGQEQRISFLKVSFSRFEDKRFIENCSSSTPEEFDPTECSLNKVCFVFKHNFGRIQEVVTEKEQSKSISDGRERLEKLGVVGDLALQAINRPDKKDSPLRKLLSLRVTRYDMYQMVGQSTFNLQVNHHVH